MRRKFWAVLLGIGAVAGFASGFRSLHYMGHGPCACGWAGRHANFEAHVADVCTEAVERAQRARGNGH
ncbi:MAG TPA: hypothetical protein VFQ35_15875 [Polyangiaceae bacterium]|nr:hypothetical protein [Polyangiaceae bacterium]